MKGFTKDEFITYIKKLKKNSEPRPFSKYPPCFRPFYLKNSITHHEILCILLIHSFSISCFAISFFSASFIDPTPETWISAY
jgi:hypothetical protein